MATDQKLKKILKLENVLYSLQSERNNIIKALQHIRVLKEKCKIERLQVNSKIRELETKKKVDQKAEKTQLQSGQTEPLPGPSRKPNISLIGADMSFLDDPLVINQTELNLDVICDEVLDEEELVEEELETEEE